MRARHGKGVRGFARTALGWMVHRLEDLAVAIVRLTGRRRRRAGPPLAPGETPAHADERTARRLAEAERGGLGSAESAARWASGDNPGGLHHKAVRRETPEHPRPADDEPQDRKERVPRGEKHMPTNRRG